MGTSTEAFSFDAPVASFVALNVPHSGRGSVTVTGLQFGLSEYTASAAVSAEACVTSSWLSSTSLACLGSFSRSSGGQSTRVTEVTVGGFVGTGLDIFSFDSPAMSDVLRNAPLSGDGSVTVTGLGFGVFEYTATAAFGTAACSTTSWSSASSVVCQASDFYSYPGYVEVTVGAMTGTGAAVHTYDFGRAGVFSFDAPVGSGVMLNAAAQRRRVSDCEWAELREQHLHGDSGAGVGTLQHIVMDIGDIGGVPADRDDARAADCGADGGRSGGDRDTTSSHSMHL